MQLKMEQWLESGTKNDILTLGRIKIKHLLSFIIRRLSYGFLVLLGVLTVVFSSLIFGTYDPARMMLGQRADQEAIDEINRELGGDKNHLLI